MANEYYTVLTDTGKNKIADAQSGGPQVELTTIHAGDGGGETYYDNYDLTALEGLTDLVNEVWSAQLNDLSVDPDNPNWVVAEGVIPADTGGWMVRELGIKDTAGDLIAIGRFPPTYKPALSDGAAQDLLLRTIMEVSNADAVTLEVDPGVALASQSYVQHQSKASYIAGAVFEGTVADGDAVYWDAANGQYAKAIADNSAASLAVGFADVTRGRVYRDGLMEDLLSGLTQDAVYYLSAATAGAVTTSRPTQLVRMGRAFNTTDMLVGLSEESFNNEDRSTGQAYRLVVVDGVLGLEEVS